MTWLVQLPASHPVAHAIGILSLVCMAGMALGSAKVRGVGLGSAGVLFAGIIAGHFSRPVDQAILDFVRELGLILFVFTIGLQLGPGFFAVLRQHGVKMNALAAANVLLAAVIAPLLGRLAGFDTAAVLGIFSGASINTPSLGTSAQTLGTLAGIAPNRLALPSLACAVTFPMAIVAVIGTILLLKVVFRIDPVREAADLTARNRRKTDPLERRTLVVINPNLDGVRVDAIPGRIETSVAVSRIRRGEETLTAIGSTTLQPGDSIVAIGTRAGLDQFQRVVGGRSDEDLVLAESNVTSRRVVVTDRTALGRTIRGLDLDNRFGVVVTRIFRSDIEMSAVPELSLQFGDMVQIVGRDADLDKATGMLGNSLKELNETHFIPLFFGLFLGIVLGTVPIAVPGLPHSVRLGLAGGPLIVALVFGRIGHLKRLVWHMPENANKAFREFGIALFFAAVGLAAGPKFFAAAFSAVGLQWLLTGVCVTVLPLMLVGIFARVVWKMNFIDLSGFLAGSMTAPPALAFANGLVRSESPTVAYATVYPLTMLLRILAAQALALMLCK